jgi:hypothetical protein
VGEFYITTAAFVSAIVLLGVALIVLARWSRRYNARLTQQYGAAPQRRAIYALANRRWREYLEFNFFGDLGRRQERFAKVLMSAVIVFVAAVLLSLGWLLLRLF